MKTLIATAILAMASTSALAFNASIDPNEFYSGHEHSASSSVSGNLNNNLYVEGNFIQVDLDGSPKGAAIGNAELPSGLYVEGNFTI